jgi:5-methylcytosine-specific restriction protein A
MPTIRVDDEVYAWLQDQARPFEDTPNSVLRRVANIGVHEPPSNNGAKKVRQSQARKDLSGKELNEAWGVGAKHALYHREGRWYENLARFPGALFDPNGYVLFATENAYRTSRHLQIAQKTNVPSGIASIPGYVRKKK